MAKTAQQTATDTGAVTGDVVTLPAVSIPENGTDAHQLPDLPPPNQHELAALGDWCAYTKIMYNRLSMSQSPYADFMADMLSIFEPLIESAKGEQ